MNTNVFLRYHKDTAVLVRDYCDKQKALWMGNVIFYTDNTFEDASVPLVYEGQYNLDGNVSSAAFVPQSHLVVVIDGFAFLHLLNSPYWTQVQGQTHPVTDVSTLQCCIDEKDLNCKKISNTVLLYNKGSAMDNQEVFLSDNGGYSYITLPLTSSTKEFLGGIYTMPTISSMVALVVGEDKRFYFRHATPKDSSRLSDTYPLKDNLGEVQVIQVAGMRGHLVIWSPHMVLYSPNNGLVIVPVLEIGEENRSLPPPGLTVWGIATADTGVIAVITSDGVLYYGRLSLEAAVIKFPKNIINDMSSQLVPFFDKYGDFVMLQPAAMVYRAVPFQTFKINVQEQLSQTTPAVIPCPVERFSGNFDGKLFYIDVGGFVKMIVVYVPIPLCPFFPVATVTNAEALIATETIVEDGVTPEGYKTFRMDIDVRQLPEAGIPQKEVLSTVTVDLMERKLSCNNLNPQKAYVIIGCPPLRQIRVIRNTTACTRGTFTEEQLQDDFSYTIPKEVYDPELHFNPNMAKEDLTVKYSYTDFLCPMLVYHDIPWRPTFELWQGDTFVEIVKADFVMFEIHGMHNYRYLQTAKKCVSQPQDWNSMLANQINPDPNTAWTRRNYRRCNDYNGPPLTNPNAEYQVLNQQSKNRIVFSNYNGMYTFKAVVVDPTYRYIYIYIYTLLIY
ncbi:cation channel sperm-associated protein subunit delta isoform X2 [Clupea harengus]|uniref:Cation channel sperm-associated auxiliary subunit delta n=1 Tax=Clupea harengus TaxID=7950 RepID=A0A8M1KML3_CLUHA|nr:cation channel sperm-associated protein subunit delta isoform X2 [Clupea harengus]